MSEPNDHDWLLARERGEDVSHVPAETRARYEHLQTRIKNLADEAPSVAWKQRVLAALDAPKPPRRRWWMAAAGGLAAAAIVIVLLGRRGGQPQEPDEPLTTEVRPSATPHRGGEVSIGDTLIVRARADGPAELRVYGETGELLARCSERGELNCRLTRDGNRRLLEIELTLRARGAVRSVLYLGTMPAPVNLADDQAAADRAHVATITKPVIQVE